MATFELMSCIGQCRVIHHGLKVTPIASVFFSSPQCYSRIQTKNTLTCIYLQLLQWEWKCNKSRIPKKYRNKQCPVGSVQCLPTLCDLLLSRTVNCEDLNKPAQVRIAPSVLKMFTYICSLFSTQEQNCTRFFHYLLEGVDGGQRGTVRIDKGVGGKVKVKWSVGYYRAIGHVCQPWQGYQPRVLVMTGVLAMCGSHGRALSHVCQS